MNKKVFFEELINWFDSGFVYNTAIEITEDEAEILVNQIGLTEITYKNRKQLRGL